MSDLNLPTVTFDAHPGELYLDDLYEALDRVVTGRRYALVPVEQMEKVWWCRVQDTMWPQSVDGRCDHDEEGECVAAWRWLVSAEGAER